jgi:UTP-glucose-1-phosphate uridylyltransferase
MSVTLVILAAGLSRRYGRLKQLEPIGPGDEALMDYAMYDALRSGFDRAVIITRREIAGALRQHVESRFGGTLDFDFAYQELDALPAGFAPPPGREKPWGSGHAVLAAAKAVDGPFVVANADDFYGALPYAALREHLLAHIATAPPVYALAGYALETTLSAFGGVSRAVCATDKAGRLQNINEIFDIHRADDGILGRTAAGGRVRLDARTLVSMNLWAFTPAIFATLQAQFARFLAANANDPDAEFLISTAIDEQVRSGANVAVLPAGSVWLGVTFAEDRARVSEQIRTLIASGEYPTDLKAAVRALKS